MAVGVTLPLPLSRRLDLLVERLESEGAHAYRKDVIAALILAAPESGKELAGLVRRYRRALARDANVGQDAALVLDGRRPKPGRRPRASRLHGN